MKFQFYANNFSKAKTLCRKKLLQKLMAVTCPNCNAKYQRLEVRDDKSNIIGHAAGKTMYGKQYLCKDCTHRWSDKDN